MHFTHFLALTAMATNPALALPTDTTLFPRDNVDCYPEGASFFSMAEEEVLSVCEPMSGFYQPGQRIKHCRGNGPLGHINFEIQRTGDDPWEMSYDSCVGYFTKIIYRCENGGTDRNVDHTWWVKADPQLGHC